MRTIKFRGWDTKRNKMYSAEEMGADELTINPDGRGFVNVSGASTQLSTYMRHIIPEQFTGHLDKNGKEIYEGDVVGKIFIEGDKYEKGEVVFDGGCFSIKISHQRYIPALFEPDPEFLEVIGNIHSKVGA